MITLRNIEKNLKPINMSPINISSGVITLSEQEDRALFDLLFLKDVSNYYGEFIVDDFNVLLKKKSDKNLSVLDINSSVASFSCVFLVDNNNLDLIKKVQESLAKAKNIKTDSESGAMEKISTIFSTIESFSPAYIIINFLKEENIKYKSFIKSQMVFYKEKIAFFELENSIKGVKFDSVATIDIPTLQVDEEDPIFSSNYIDFLKKNALYLSFTSLSFIFSILGLTLFSFSLNPINTLHLAIGLIFGILGIISGVLFLTKVNQTKSTQYDEKKEKHVKMINEFLFSFAGMIIGVAGIFLMSKFGIIFVDLEIKDYIVPISVGLIFVIFSTLSTFINQFAFKLVTKKKKIKRTPVNSSVKRHNKNQKDSLDD